MSVRGEIKNIHAAVRYPPFAVGYFGGREAVQHRAHHIAVHRAGGGGNLRRAAAGEQPFKAAAGAPREAVETFAALYRPRARPCIGGRRQDSYRDVPQGRRERIRIIPRRDNPPPVRRSTQAIAYSAQAAKKNKAPRADKKNARTAPAVPRRPAAKAECRAVRSKPFPRSRATARDG